MRMGTRMILGIKTFNNEHQQHPSIEGIKFNQVTALTESRPT